MHQNLIVFRRGLWLWVGLFLTLASALLYWSQADATPPSGGTWQGYTLGGIATALILWLTWLGVRKRSYKSRSATVQGWTAAHIGLGLATLPIATLHAAFQVGWNVHTLAYVLMASVVVSGIYGLFAYMAMPRRLARISRDRTRDEWLTELNKVDARLRELATSAAEHTRAVVESAIDRTTLGGGALAQLFGIDFSRVLDPDATGGRARFVSNRQQRRLVDHLAARIPLADGRGETAALQELLSLASRRRMVLDTLRKGIRVQARLQVWLYFHIPLTMALLAALSVHILVVFLYW